MISYIRANFMVFKLFGFVLINILLCLQIFILIINYKDYIDNFELNYFINIVSCVYITLIYLIILYSIKYHNRQNENLVVAFTSCTFVLYLLSIASFIVNIKDNNIPPINTLQWITTIWFFILSISLVLVFKIHKKIIIFCRSVTSNRNNSNNVQNQLSNQTNNETNVIFVIVDVNKQDISNDNCSICMLSLRSNIPVKTSCNHIFHNECIMKNINLYKNNKCPLCRTELCVI